MDQNNEKNNNGIQFQDTEWRRTIVGSQQAYKTSKMVGRLIKLSGGLLKTEKQANYMFLTLAAVAIIISLFLIFGE